VSIAYLGPAPANSRLIDEFFRGYILLRSLDVTRPIDTPATAAFKGTPIDEEKKEFKVEKFNLF
jgi:hypothetical protein